jgi:hypothetical protein
MAAAARRGRGPKSKLAGRADGLIDLFELHSTTTLNQVIESRFHL